MMLENGTQESGAKSQQTLGGSKISENRILRSRAKVLKRKGSLCIISDKDDVYWIVKRFKIKKTFRRQKPVKGRSVRFFPLSSFGFLNYFQAELAYLNYLSYICKRQKSLT